MTEHKEGRSDCADIAVQLKKVLAKPVVLIGMMGAGKTKIGRALARKLGFRFYDSDSEIEKAAGTSILDIFDFYGEAAFREVESKVIGKLLKKNGSVIATGGGAILSELNRRKILENAVTIWLDADVDVIYNRIAHHTHRPLLQTDNPKAALDKILSARADLYRQAHIHVRSEEGDFQDMVELVLTSLQEYLEQSLNRKYL